jgi:hypothetical protein
MRGFPRGSRLSRSNQASSCASCPTSVSGYNFARIGELQDTASKPTAIGSLKIMLGRVPKRTKGTDCKSVIRRFESDLGLSIPHRAPVVRHPYIFHPHIMHRSVQRLHKQRATWPAYLVWLKPLLIRINRFPLRLAVRPRPKSIDSFQLHLGQIPPAGIPPLYRCFQSSLISLHPAIPPSAIRPPAA